ncbi:MAG: recombinase family protein [Phycisphaeraceae bacterium]|nr:recombinase family protein [Phycisphaeraceae bacterium]MCB9848765.1 recombinase family protein [Phycisphaeraceae bacterium]
MSKRDPKIECKRVRCAIYTRKSTEEGLEQEFNTLDAQRESAEAFIASQKAEGWVCLPDRYDDGGFSGGNVDRPALKRLIDDIEAGLVDCIVVYKVDRLSRSLMDFARMMATFEEHGVSFVSVTQQFNTTHSMGRLTLNILLSFAQFEREIISERTRDKIAAARRKGRWAGGRPVLGYDLVSLPGGGRLEVNRDEAERVRRIFDAYLELGSLMPAVAECARQGWTTKKWTTKAGKPMGGRALDKGAVYALLTNPVYIGKVRHNENIYEGMHDGIVDADVFDRVQANLRLNGRTGGSRLSNAHGALLKGLVRCASCDCSMIHHFASKKTGGGTKRYRYYVCTKAQKLGWASCPGPSLPAMDLESFVLERIREVVTRDATVDAVARRALELLAERRPDLVVDPDEIIGAAESFDPVWDAMTHGEREDLIRAIVARVEWDAPNETISVTFREGIPAEDAEEAVAA